MKDKDHYLNKAVELVETAQAKGADAADAICVGGTSLSVACRKGVLENFSRAEGVDIGLRVFLGRRQAIVSSSDFSKATVNKLVDRAIAMAKVIPEDEYCGLAPESLLVRNSVKLENFDANQPSESDLEKRALVAEEAALNVAGVSNTEGAEASWGKSIVSLAASNGFAATRLGSSHSISVSVLAGEGTAMERDYDYALSVYGEDLLDPELLGRSAGEKAVSRLNPRKVSTSQVPVIFDPRVSNSLLSHFSSAINGSSVARGTTFLKDKMYKKVFRPGINIFDDPLRVRGLRSREFDAEGIQTSKQYLVENGELKSWLLDLRSARQLKMETKGHASRGTSSSPSPSASNLYMEPGPQSPEELIGDVDNGFYVTELIGMGVDGVTGDYSRGATGYWIEKGQIEFPVSEMTIAGNLSEMFENTHPANNLIFRFGTNAPTLRGEGLTVAGK